MNSYSFEFIATNNAPLRGGRRFALSCIFCYGQYTPTEWKKICFLLYILIRTIYPHRVVEDLLPLYILIRTIYPHRVVEDLLSLVYFDTDNIPPQSGRSFAFSCIFCYGQYTHTECYILTNEATGTIVFHPIGVYCR